MICAKVKKQLIDGNQNREHHDSSTRLKIKSINLGVYSS